MTLIRFRSLSALIYCNDWKPLIIATLTTNAGFGAIFTKV